MASTAARFANTVPMLILRSPVHRLMSGRYAIIEFTGRKSGRRYATPIAYVRDGDRVLLSTDSPWWRNLKGGATVPCDSAVAPCREPRHPCSTQTHPTR